MPSSVLLEKEESELTMSVVLRDYQEAAIRAMFAASETKTSQVVIMATGMGKTVAASEFMKRWLILAMYCSWHIVGNCWTRR